MGAAEGTNGMNIKELMSRDTATVIFSMTCDADQARQRAHAGVPKDRIIPFTVVMPDGLTDDERTKWIRSVTEALEVVVADAHKDIMVDRTFAMMKDLGLGDGRED